MFLILMKWLFWYLRMNQIEWDMSTITAEDYTVEMKIDFWEYKVWQGVFWGIGTDQGCDKSDNVAPCYSLKRYLRDEIEARLNEDLLAKQALHQ